MQNKFFIFKNQTNGKTQWEFPVTVGIDCHMERIQVVMKASAPLPECSKEDLASVGVLDSLSGSAFTYTFAAPAAGALAEGCIFV